MAGTKLLRVQAVLSGQKPDRPPVSFWHHFSKAQWAGQAAVDAHLEHLERFDLDFLKVMNDNGYPRPESGPAVSGVQDLKKLRVCQGDEPPFAAQLDVIRRLAARIKDDLFFCTTVFSAWAVLRNLTQPPSDKHGPPTIDVRDDPRDEAITAMLREDRSAVAAALRTIAESLANFARNCIDAGADGIFLSVRDDWVDTRANGQNTYDEMVRQTDRIILEAAGGGRFNMLHICGRPLNFAAFAQYPVHVINWADRVTGPSIAYARDRVKPAICAGLNNLGTLVAGTPEQCANEARDALRQARDRPILVAPGCTYDPQAVPEANLRAVCAALREAG